MFLYKGFDLKRPTNKSFYLISLPIMSQIRVELSAGPSVKFNISNEGGDAFLEIDVILTCLLARLFQPVWVGCDFDRLLT